MIMLALYILLFIGFFALIYFMADVFIDNLKDCGTLLWNGPLGIYEISEFSKGSLEVAKFIGNLDCVKVIGGGDTASMIHAFGLEEKYTHVSTGGGASLEEVSGDGLIALKEMEKLFHLSS